MSRSNLKELEAKLEYLRSKIQWKVGNDDKRLRDPEILPLSRELDELIVAYMKEKIRTKS